MKVLAVATLVALVGGMAWAGAPAKLGKVGVEDGNAKEGLTVDTKKPKLTAPEGRTGPVVFVGRITSVSATGQVVVVNGNEADPHDVSKSLGAPEDRSFKIGASCRIKTEDKSRASIKDLESGLDVLVRFDKDIRGNYKADSLEPLGAVEERQEESRKRKAEEKKKKEEQRRR